MILAVPPDVQQRLCGGLKAHDPGYARMLDHSHTVVTQAAQLWLDRSAEELGQEFSSRTLMSTYVEPLDTYCDMAHLLPNEQWPEQERARHIAYFCGVLPTARVPDQHAADGEVQAHLAELVADHGTRLWPAAARNGGAFDYALLAPPLEPPRPEEPFSHQFWRANFAPTERYVLSLPGTIEHRLPADGTSFTNLVLAGDWTVQRLRRGLPRGGDHVGHAGLARDLATSPRSSRSPAWTAPRASPISRRSARRPNRNQRRCSGPDLV